MQLGVYKEKLVWLALCVPLFALTHLANAWLFDQLSLSAHISWIYLPAFLRVAYVLIFGPVWGFGAIFLGSLLLGFRPDETLFQAFLNAVASALGPVLALGLFRLLKERPLQLVRLSDLIQMSLLYALLNAVVHHFCWAYQQPNQLMSVSQLPIMMVGDLLGALLGAYVFTLFIRHSGVYRMVERRSKEKSNDAP